MHIYSDAEKQFFAEFVPGHSHKEITEEFNRRFDYKISIGQTKGCIARYKLNTGRTGYFEKGHIPFNKGEHFISGGRSVETQFKKGHTPHNHKPVGSERITRDGYIEIKVAEPNKWKLKHRVVYEKAYGPLKRGEVVIFKDQNKLNLSPGNLMAIERRKLVLMNGNNLFSKEARVTETGVNIVGLIMAINDVKRKEVKK